MTFNIQNHTILRILKNPEYNVKSLISYLTKNDITSLNLSGNTLSNEAILKLCEALKSPETFVETLDLSYNPMSEETALHVSEMLKKNVTLTHVNLSHNNIKSEHQFFSLGLGRVLMGNPTLRVLDISHNNLDDNSFLIVLNGIRQCKHRDLSDLCLNIEGNVITNLNWNNKFQEALSENQLNFLSHQNKKLGNKNQLLKSGQYPILFGFSLQKLLPVVAATGLFLGVAACDTYTRFSK